MKRELRLRRNLQQLREIIRNFDMKTQVTARTASGLRLQTSSVPFESLHSKTGHTGRRPQWGSSTGFGGSLLLGSLKPLFSSPNINGLPASSGQRRLSGRQRFGTTDLSEQLRKMSVVSKDNHTPLGRPLQTTGKSTRNLSRVLSEMKRSRHDMKKASSLYLLNKSNELGTSVDPESARLTRTAQALGPPVKPLTRCIESQERNYYLPIGGEGSVDSGEVRTKMEQSGRFLGQSGHFSMMSNSKCRSLERTKNPHNQIFLNNQTAERQFLADFMRESLKFHVKENVNLNEAAK